MFANNLTNYSPYHTEMRQQHAYKERNQQAFPRETAYQVRPAHNIHANTFNNCCVNQRYTYKTTGDASADHSRQPNEPAARQQQVRDSCPMHSNSAKPHALAECREFIRLPQVERHRIASGSRACFRCLKDHPIRSCNSTTKCNICSSDRHHTLRHQARPINVVTHCTQRELPTRLCSKIIPVTISSPVKRDKRIETLAIMDEQSNTTLAHPDIFDALHVETQQVHYTLNTLGENKTHKTGRLGDFLIQGKFRTELFNLRNVTECDSIPNSAHELATCEDCENWPHLRKITRHLPTATSKMKTILLIGRDASDAIKVLEVRNGADLGQPYAHRLCLGWSAMGSINSGTDNKESQPPQDYNADQHRIQAYKLHRERRCFKLTVQPTISPSTVFNRNYMAHRSTSHFEAPPEINTLNLNKLPQSGCTDRTGDLAENPFSTTKDQDTLDLSRDDQLFLRQMEAHIHTNADGFLEAPLPFKSTATSLPENREEVRQRTERTLQGIKRQPKRLDDSVKFMQKFIDNKHAEEAPNEASPRHWYLPVFLVYHKKKKKPRIVFANTTSL